MTKNKPSRKKAVKATKPVRRVVHYKNVDPATGLITSPKDRKIHGTKALRPKTPLPAEMEMTEAQAQERMRWKLANMPDQMNPGKGGQIIPAFGGIQPGDSLAGILEAHFEHLEQYISNLRNYVRMTSFMLEQKMTQKNNSAAWVDGTLGLVNVSPVGGSAVLVPFPPGHAPTASVGCCGNGSGEV